MTSFLLIYSDESIKLIQYIHIMNIFRHAKTVLLKFNMEGKSLWTFTKLYILDFSLINCRKYYRYIAIHIRIMPLSNFFLNWYTPHISTLSLNLFKNGPIIDISGNVFGKLELTNSRDCVLLSLKYKQYSFTKKNLKQCSA